MSANAGRYLAGGIKYWIIARYSVWRSSREITELPLLRRYSLFWLYWSNPQGKTSGTTLVYNENFFFYLFRFFFLFLFFVFLNFLFFLNVRKFRCAWLQYILGVTRSHIFVLSPTTLKQILHLPNTALSLCNIAKAVGTKTLWIKVWKYAYYTPSSCTDKGDITISPARSRERCVLPTSLHFFFLFVF